MTLPYLASDLLKKQPDFNELTVNSGVLKRIGCLDGFRIRYLPVWIESNGTEIKFKLPPIVTRDQLANNIGHTINIHTYKNWQGSDDVWHVTGNNKVYFGYKDRLRAAQKNKPFFVTLKLFATLSLVFFVYIIIRELKSGKAETATYNDGVIRQDDTRAN